MVESTAQAAEGGIPQEQWAIQVKAGKKWEVERVKVPRPASGQVLVKIECAPINPSDTYFLAGHYGGDDDDSGPARMILPIAPGWEGAGTVVESGGGLMAWRLVGKRVAVTKCQEPNNVMSIGGCYQQYMVTSALQCIPLPDEVTLEQGSMHCVNPLTAIGLIDMCKQNKSPAFIQTASASQLGRMVMTLAREEGLEVINIVRKEEQAEISRKYGAEHVLNSTEPDFLDKLGELAKKLRATVCFDAIAGEITGQIMSRMPSRSVCYLYGMLSEQPVSEIDPLKLIGRGQRLEGFLLNVWLEEKSLWAKLSIIRKCQKMLNTGTFKSEVQKRVSLFEVREAIPEYKKNMTAGKYLIYPQWVTGHMQWREGQGEEEKKE